MNGILGAPDARDLYDATTALRLETGEWCSAIRSQRRRSGSGSTASSPPTCRTSSPPRPSSCTHRTDRPSYGGIAVCHAVDDAYLLESDVLALRRFGSPAADMIERMPYPAVNTGVDLAVPPGSARKLLASRRSSPSSSGRGRRGDDQGVRSDRPDELCALVVEDFHGAVTRVPLMATAYPEIESRASTCS